MSMKCRILSIVVIVVGALVACVGIGIVVNKNNNKKVYATSVHFVGDIGGAEVYIENQIVINKQLVEIKPSNCSFSPVFTIKKQSTGVEEVVKQSRYTFNATGKYIVTCKIKAHKDYYIYDSFSINVVDTITDNTHMYILPKTGNMLYVEDSTTLDQLATIAAPNDVNIQIKCSEHLNYKNNIFTAVKQGWASVDISVNYHCITIIDTVNVSVRPKTIQSNIDLVLTFGGSVVQDNIINISGTEFNVLVDYNLLNIDNQTINCWTDSSVVEIISFNSPTIVLKPKSVGSASVYISPIDHPGVVFEMFINITASI